MITVPVADRARSRAFYADGLGWEPFIGPGVAPLTIAHNVGSDEAVDDVLRTAGAAGGQVWPAEHRDWGGYSGYFADPDGYRWEIAHTGAEGLLDFLVP